jgi:hypothetical protein
MSRAARRPCATDVAIVPLLNLYPLPCRCAAPSSRQPTDATDSSEATGELAAKHVAWLWTYSRAGQTPVVVVALLILLQYEKNLFEETSIACKCVHLAT